MSRVLKKMMIVGLIVGFSTSVSFADIVYTATRGVGTGTVDLSITTDGTLGVLSTANLLDWTISMTDGPDTFTLLGSNSERLVVGSALTATPSDLLFDFDSALGQFVLIQSPNIGAGQLFWSVQTSSSFDFDGPAEAIDPRTNFSFVRMPYSGNLVIASAVPVVVPEPASLTLFGMGAFSLFAGAIRRRGHQKA